MSPKWSDALGFVVAAATLPLAGSAHAQPGDAARVCTPVLEVPPVDDAAAQMEAVVGELRQGLDYFGHRLADDACDDEIGLSLRRDAGAWRVDVHAFGAERSFVAPPGEAARAVVPDVLRYVDRALVEGGVPASDDSGRRRRGGSAPESGTQWFPTIGFTVSAVDRRVTSYRYPYYGVDIANEPGHAEAGAMAPTMAPTLGLAVRWNAGGDLSGQVELQLEHIGGQDAYIGPLYGEHDRALYLMVPALARFRMSTSRQRELHGYVGIQGGFKLFESQMYRALGVPIGSSGYYEYADAPDHFGQLLAGAVGGLQFERPSRVRDDGTTRRREVDLRFGLVSHVTDDGPRYGGTLGVRWRFGR